MEFFTLKSEARKVTACRLIQELPPEIIKSSREAILQAASEGRTFVNIEDLPSDQAGKLATMYNMLDFQAEAIQGSINYVKGQGYVGNFYVTIRWED
jgi:hypothetical protein